MLDYLELSHFRNYSRLSFVPHPSLTFICGPNGSGKTSLIEAIYLLGTGRSFRTSRLSNLISENASETILYADIQQDHNAYRLGMARNRQGFTGLRLNGQNLRGLSELARVFPVQVFHPGIVDIVEGPATLRRRYIDWGLFHVEPSFLDHWRKLTSAVSQRNRLLKQASISRRELEVWTQQVAAASVKIDQLRRGYLSALLPLIDSMAHGFDEVPGVRPELYSGWPERENLQALLLADLPKDRERGFTSRGAHRADLRLTTQGGLVKEILSRGQCKVYAYLLLLAQLKYLIQHRAGSCLLLVDDLASELDQHHRGQVMNILLDLGQQMLITALDQSQIEQTLALRDELPENTMFHVEHGVIRETQ